MCMYITSKSSRPVHAVRSQIAGTYKSVEAGVRVRSGLSAEAVEQAYVSREKRAAASPRARTTAPAGGFRTRLLAEGGKKNDGVSCGATSMHARVPLTTDAKPHSTGTHRFCFEISMTKSVEMGILLRPRGCFCCCCCCCCFSSCCCCNK